MTDFGTAVPEVTQPDVGWWQDVNNLTYRTFPPFQAAFSAIQSQVSGQYALTQSQEFETVPVNANTTLTIGGLGSVWQSQFHSNWNVVQTTAKDNPTEFQVYSSASGGTVTTTAGTNQVTWNAGAQFESYWAGLPYIYIDGAIYSVLSILSTTSLTVQTVAGSAVSWAATKTVPYYFSVTSTQGLCNVNGTAVTWVFGQAFIPYPTTISINGVSYGYTFNSSTSLTLTTSAGVLTNAVFTQYCNINNELSVLRLQSNQYLDQENFCITETANGAILETQYAGGGKYRPIKIRTGEQPAGSQQVMVALYPNATLGSGGTLLLGGDFNAEVFNISCNTNAVNYWYAQAGPAGFGPSLASRGTDTAPGMGLDVQGPGTITFTSHSFANIEFQIFGNGGSSWLGLGSSSFNAPVVASTGAAANIDIQLQPKGTGLVWIGPSTTATSPPAFSAAHRIQVKDTSGATWYIPVNSTPW